MRLQWQSTSRRPPRAWMKTGYALGVQPLLAGATQVEKVIVGATQVEKVQAGATQAEELPVEARGL
jgi:hypothetical protein